MDEPLSPSGGALVAERVVFGYGAPVLRGVDLCVSPGQCVVLLGANGAGKTTLLRLLGGLLAPESGRVRLGDRDPFVLAAADRAVALGYLPQRIPPAPGYAVCEIVLMGLYSLLPARGLESHRDWLTVGRALRRVGANRLMRRRFDELSGGEQRRVLLARTLVARPRVLLLDEPMAALDPGFALELEETLAALKAAGVALVLSTHRLEVARRLADRVLMLHEGVALADGEPDEVMTAVNLDRTYRTHRFGSVRARGTA